MSVTRLKTKLALGAAISVAMIGGAMAAPAPINFTWNPAGATPSLNGGTITNANNYNVADFASATVNTTAGSFTETGALNVLNFLNNGTPVAATGLGSTYSLYLLFSGAGNLPGLPSSPGTSTNGTYSSLSYRLIGSTSGAPTFSVTDGNVATIDPGTATVLGYGDLVPGTGFVTTVRTANGISPTANVNLSFNECLAAGQGGVCTANEAGFFVAPPPNAFKLQIGNFSATDTVTRLDAVGATTYVNITGGGGNLTYVPVPEPASLALLGMGLLGMVGLRRRLFG